MRKLESLVPAFLKDLDKHLLLNYPTLWATKIPLSPVWGRYFPVADWASGFVADHRSGKPARLRSCGLALPWCRYLSLSCYGPTPPLSLSRSGTLGLPQEFDALVFR